MIKIVKANKKENGINFGAIPTRFKVKYLKYVLTGYPFSIIKSRKFTALTVKAITDKPKSITKNVFKISRIKF